jgi:hypothetical protein
MALFPGVNPIHSISLQSYAIAEPLASCAMQFHFLKLT